VTDLAFIVSLLVRYVGGSVCKTGDGGSQKGLRAMMNKFCLGIGALGTGALSCGVVWATPAETVKGTVTDVFGHRFVVEGEAGKTLVDIGPKGLNLVAVKVGDQVTVDGKRKRSEIKAERVTVGADAPVEVRRGKKGDERKDD
jgi:hypothetical protein